MKSRLRDLVRFVYGDARGAAAAFAKKLGVPDSNVRAWLDDARRNTPGALALARIQSTYQVDMNWLVSGVVHTGLCLRVNAVRFDKRLKPREFAKRVEVDPGILAAIERGETEPSPLLIEKICRVFGVNRYSMIAGPFHHIAPLPTTGSDVEDYEAAKREMVEAAQNTGPVRERIVWLLREDREAESLVLDLLQARKKEREALAALQGHTSAPKMEGEPQRGPLGGRKGRKRRPGARP